MVRSKSVGAKDIASSRLNTCNPIERKCGEERGIRRCD